MTNEEAQSIRESEVRSLGTAVPVSTTVEAVVNAPRMVTLYSRITGAEFGTYPEAQAIDFQRENPNMTPARYDLDEAEAELLGALAAVPASAAALITARKRLGYVPLGEEGAWNATMGALQRAAQILSLALGASLPSEATVAAWIEHEQASGGLDVGFRYERDTEGNQIGPDIKVEKLEAYPNLNAIVKRAAIDAYVTEKGAMNANS